MFWLREIANIFDLEDETFMPYLYGNRLAEYPHLRDSRQIVHGLFLQCIQVIYRMLKNFRLGWAVPINSHFDYFLYAGSQNQMSALQSTLRALNKRDAKAFAFVEKGVYKLLLSKNDTAQISYTIFDIARTSLVMLLRAPLLRRRLLKKNEVSVLREFSIRFVSAYIYVPYFLKVLKKIKPNYVLVSNDHNVANRALIAVAYYLKIQTVYMQHASVSKYFPALRFNYAFLDGKASLETYLACENSGDKPSSLYPVPTVFLSGQKKMLEKRDSRRRQIKLGVAINALDRLEDTVELTKELVNAGFEVSIRWHPTQGSEYVRKLRVELCGEHGVAYSDPRNSDVSDFLCSCFAVVASNTSIHLEAALSGVPSVYYEISVPSVPDVYGYVQNHLVPHIKSGTELIEFLREFGDSMQRIDNRLAVKFYSTSFGTRWEGREGDLVAETLELLRNYQAIEDLYFECDNNFGFAAVYSLS